MKTIVMDADRSFEPALGLQACLISGAQQPKSILTTVLGPPSRRPEAIS